MTFPTCLLNISIKIAAAAPDCVIDIERLVIDGFSVVHDTGGCATSLQRSDMNK